MIAETALRKEHWMMRPFISTLGLVGGLFATQVATAASPDARYFRIAGPVPTTITDVATDGTITWTNLATNGTFTVQISTALAGASDWVDWVQVPASNAVTVHHSFDPNPPAGMALIPAGSFTMGDILDGTAAELPLHSVYVSSFYMDRYEVTKALWDEVYNWALTHGYSFDFSNSGKGKAATHPAHSMTWYDCVKWCNARSEKEGRLPAYYTNAVQTAVYRTGQFINFDSAWVNWNSGYRLPTEAEWEKAARGGASGHRFPWSNADTISHAQANYSGWPASDGGYPYDFGNSGMHPAFNDGVTPYTSPVGSFAPNGYGLHDMAGNVEEWCWDLKESYNSAAQTDPRGPAFGNSGHVTRGGSWTTDAIICRSARRGGFGSFSRGDGFGFRSVLPRRQ